jgi:hypothetical protein
MKTLLLLLVLVFSLTVVRAQRGNPEFGIKGGVNVSHFKLEPSYNTDGRISLHLGALAHFHVTHHFALQPELVLSGQGADYGEDREDKFTYLNLPILAQVMFGEGFRLQTGPQAGYLLNAKSENNNVEVDIDDNFNRFEAGWVFGGGYISRSGLGIDVRYNLGLSNISEVDAVKVKNRVWQLGLFYQFRNKR